MLYVKRVKFTVSPEAAQFIRDAILDSADYVEDALRGNDAPAVINGKEVDPANVIKELRRVGREIEGTMLLPATPSEYNEILDIN